MALLRRTQHRSLVVLRVLIALAAVTGCDAVTVVEGERANEALAGLRRAGIAAELRGRAVTVPGAEVARAVEVLRTHESPVLQCDRPLLSTEPEVRMLREGVLAARIATMLRALPGVASARVTVALPPPPDFEGTAPAAPRIALALDTRGEITRLAELRTLAAAAVHGARAEEVQLSLRPLTPSPEPRYVRVGPWAVAPSSAPSLRALPFVVSGLAAATVLLTRLVRARRKRA